MNGKRDRIAELRAYAERSNLAYEQGAPDWLRVEQILKVYGLSREIETDEAIRSELHRHIVVSLVAIIQASVRRTIAQIADHREERGQPLPEPRDVKLTLGMVRELKNHKFSVGELLAHFLSVAGVDQISFALNQVCERDLNSILLMRFLDKTRPIQEGSTPEDAVRKARERLVQMFYYRNIYCHEEGIGVSIKETELYGFIVTTITFVSALDIFRGSSFN
jgi:hypothetical protein